MQGQGDASHSIPAEVRCGIVTERGFGTGEGST